MVNPSRESPIYGLSSVEERTPVSGEGPITGQRAVYANTASSGTSPEEGEWVIQPQQGDLLNADQSPTIASQAGQANIGDSPEANRFPRKERKASIKIATCNIKGRTKLPLINSMMLRKQIAILAMQETHLPEEGRAELETRFSRRLRIFASADKNNPTGKAGVAIAINKAMMATEKAKAYEIYPGRALLVKTQWRSGKPLKILNIYAPNVSPQCAKESAAFFEKVQDFFENSPTWLKPDIVLGDFNIVEYPIDRLPAAADRNEGVLAIDGLMRSLHVTDGWRSTYPDKKAWTFISQKAPFAQSRLDRIYVTPTIVRAAREWKIESNPLPLTDHAIATVKISDELAPEIGKGRRAFPQRILRDEITIKYINEHGDNLLSKMRSLQRTQANNPQTWWADFEQKIMKFAVNRERCTVPKIDQEIARTAEMIEKLAKEDLGQTLDQETATELMGTRIRLAELTQYKNELEQKKFTQVRSQTNTKYKMANEAMNKTWFRLSKEVKPRDVIYALKTAQSESRGSPASSSASPEPIYEKESKRMAAMAKEYHDKLQYEEHGASNEEREAEINETLNNLKTKLTNEEKSTMRQTVGREEIEAALNQANASSAAGLDGISFELWKQLAKAYKEYHPPQEELDPEIEAMKRPVDILSVFQCLFGDISIHGKSEGSPFADGWICPIYKKNDNTEISNYRPITLLNADYKLLTKTIANRLAPLSKRLIHENQAGFIPGRQISDQTKLIRMITYLAAAKDMNGMIVALDQEKAYDKISHDYLWKTLEAFNLPQETISLIRNLYQDARSCVMINGVKSDSYQVIRGMRQGDPLSCLLFDFAIEPLAEALRSSDLKGFSIPNHPERIIATLFADDTTVFLNEEDSFEHLQTILDKWCTASKAKFNIKKTEIIPIGSITHHRTMIHERRYGPLNHTIPPNIHIAEEGELVQILGAWFGNATNDMAPWGKILEKIDSALDRWENAYPTMEGRKLIVQAVIGGMTQYLAQVQGMPKAVEEKLRRRVLSFVWDDKTSHPVSEQMLYAPHEKGGRKILDIVSRNEAIQLIWLKKLLNISEDRPLWAKVADELLAHYAQASAPKDPLCRTNPFTQTWKAAIQATSELPEELKQLALLADKYKLEMDALDVTPNVKCQMPIWYHRASSRATRRTMNNKASKCLRQRHGVKTVGDVLNKAQALHASDHSPRRNCGCSHCRKERTETGCRHPDRCFKQAKRLLDGLPSKWNPQYPSPCRVNMSEQTRLDQDTSEIDPYPENVRNIADLFRIFSRSRPTPEPAMIPLDDEPSHPDDIITAATDGSCINNGHGNAAAGAGIFYTEDDGGNRSIRLPEEVDQSNQAAELIAVHELIKETPEETELTIETDSKFVIHSLTRHRKNMEDEGYIRRKHAQIIASIIANVRKRSKRTFLRWIKGHSGHQGNEGADRLARLGAEKEESDELNFEIEPELQVTGAKLQSLTQSLAYTGIRCNKMDQDQTKKLLKRERTERTIQWAIAVVDHAFNYQPTPEAIWKNVRNKDFTKRQQYFLWMIAHDAYRTGTHWLHFGPEYESRAYCAVPDCGNDTNDLNHILTQCSSQVNEIIWQLSAEQLWQRSDPPFAWSKPNTGMIVACAQMSPPNKINKNKKYLGKYRLYRIIMIETAYLVWRIKWEMIFERQDNEPSREEIKKRWHATMNERLQYDISASNPKWGKKAMPAKKVLNTWKGILHEESYLPKDWTKRKTGVLVSIVRCGAPRIIPRSEEAPD